MASFELQSFLPYRLAVLTHRISRELATLYQERFGLTIPEWRVMANLGQFGPLSAQKVAEYSTMDKAKVSRAIARMNTAGLLSREQDPADNRAVILKLSDEGTRILKEIAPMAAAWEADLLRDMSEEEVTALHRAIDHLSAILARKGGTPG